MSVVKPLLDTFKLSANGMLTIATNNLVKSMIYYLAVKEKKGLYEHRLSHL